MNIPLADLIEKLLIVDMKIWGLESDIREGKEGKLGLDEVGKRALQIRDLNKQRIELKNEINKRFDSDNYFEEIKIKHISGM